MTTQNTTTMTLGVAPAPQGAPRKAPRGPRASREPAKHPVWISGPDCMPPLLTVEELFAPPSPIDADDDAAIREMIRAGNFDDRKGPHPVWISGPDCMPPLLTVEELFAPPSPIDADDDAAIREIISRVEKRRAAEAFAD